MTKIQVRKQFTTPSSLMAYLGSCFQYDEDTSSKAIHNSSNRTLHWSAVVFNMTKIQVRKQFTTDLLLMPTARLLFSIWRRYKFESNSQQLPCFSVFSLVVFNMTKIQVRKQFTTNRFISDAYHGCFQYDEDTSSKAIHNVSISLKISLQVVFNMTKIQVRKQFTTSA